MRKRYTELTNVLVHIAGSEALESISFLITSWMKCTRKGKGLREMIRNSLNNAPESSDIIENIDQSCSSESSESETEQNDFEIDTEDDGVDLENEESDNGDDDIEDTMSIDNTTLLQTNVESLLQQLPQRSEHRKILLHFLSQGFAIRDACKLFDVSESSLRRARNLSEVEIKSSRLFSGRNQLQTSWKLICKSEMDVRCYFKEYFFILIFFTFSFTIMNNRCSSYFWRMNILQTQESIRKY